MMPAAGVVHPCRRQGWSGLMVLGLCLGLCLQLPVGVSGHGYIIDPPSRSSAWRLGFKNPANYDDNGLYCGGFNRQWTQNGGKCGICGDPWDVPSPRPNEVGGKFANGIIVRQYSVGQVVDMSVQITTQHKGWYEFRLCPGNESIDAPTTQECLDANLLAVKDGGHRTRYLLPPNASTGLFKVKVQLPEGLSCFHCVLQWKWHTGNSWGVGSDGVGCVGCGPQEEFINCADISISYNSPSAATAASPSPKARPRSTPSSTVPSRTYNSPSAATAALPSPKARPRSTQSSTVPSRTTRSSTTLSRIVTTSSATSKTTRSSKTAPGSKTTRSSRRTSPETSKTAPGASSSTVMSDPALATKRSASGCRGIGLFEGNAEMGTWCVTNCALNFCPRALCKCDQGNSKADFSTCKSRGIWKSEAMDKWCVSNCAAGFCPSDRCQCFESSSEK